MFKPTGSCPILEFDIDSTLTIKYHGEKFTDKIGFYKGKFSQAFWDTLNFKFNKINFMKLDTSYEHSVDDLSTELFIYQNKKCKHIRGQSSSLPDSLATIIQMVD